MKSARIGLACALASLTLVGASLAAPVNYDESINGDLDQANPPTFTLDIGVNQWTGSIGPTPTANTQDAFFANLPVGLSIMSIHWEYSASNPRDQSSFDMSGPIAAAPPFGTVLSHQVAKAGDNITDTGFSLVNPILPIIVDGQYKCEATTGFAVVTSTWKITITVANSPLPTSPSTWGKIKSLYR
jgi:hypothetical protein